MQYSRLHRYHEETIEITKIFSKVQLRSWNRIWTIKNNGEYGVILWDRKSQFSIGNWFFITDNTSSYIRIYIIYIINNWKRKHVVQFIEISINLWPRFVHLFLLNSNQFLDGVKILYYFFKLLLFFNLEIWKIQKVIFFVLSSTIILYRLQTGGGASYSIFSVGLAFSEKIFKI